MPVSYSGSVDYAQRSARGRPQCTLLNAAWQPPHAAYGTVYAWQPPHAVYGAENLKSDCTFHLNTKTNIANTTAITNTAKRKSI